MAYYSGFPATYQPIYPAAQQQQQSGLNWIQGEQAAKSYLIAPNSTVVLFDSEAQVIYIKSADASGMPTMKILDYSIRETAKNPANSLSTEPTGKLSEFATKSEIAAISAEIDALQRKVNKLTQGKEHEDE